MGIVVKFLLKVLQIVVERFDVTVGGLDFLFKGSKRRFDLTVDIVVFALDLVLRIL